MAALTNPRTKPTEFAGEKKLIAFENLAIGSASDTLTLSLASNGISTIHGVMAVPSGGVDAAFSYLQVSYSGLVITIVSLEQDGTPSTEWTGTTVNLWVIGS